MGQQGIFTDIIDWYYFQDGAPLQLYESPDPRWVELWKGEELRLTVCVRFYSVNSFLDGITLISKDEASGSSVTSEEAKKVCRDNPYLQMN